jgi:hypothetical protein
VVFLYNIFKQILFFVFVYAIIEMYVVRWDRIQQQNTLGTGAEIYIWAFLIILNIFYFFSFL